MKDWIQELWYGLTYRSGFEENRRSRWAYALRAARCNAGLHWPIQLNEEHSYYEPPEEHFSCSFCGHRRLPYRAVFWSGRLWTLRHPVQAWKYRGEAR